MSVRWITVMLDLPADVLGATTAFWCAVTDTTASPARGPAGEFRTLLPATGDAFLKVQRLGKGQARTHLDLHTDDEKDLRARSERLGARLRDDTSGYATYASPGGLVYCVVGHAASAPPPPNDWGTHTSYVDQVCLDIPEDRFEDEATFWAGLLDREVHDPGDSEFARLTHRDGDPLLVLLQRCGFDGRVRAHLDLSASEREPEVDRIAGLGAAVVRVTDHWTTLRDPAGLEFCVTRRTPGEKPQHA